MLTGHHVSSLVVDRLSDQFRGQGTAVTCFYLDFAARKEQSVLNTIRVMHSGSGFLICLKRQSFYCAEQ